MNVLLSVEVINYPQILGTVETPKGTRSKMWYLSTLSITEPYPPGRTPTAIHPVSIRTVVQHVTNQFFFQVSFLLHHWFEIEIFFLSMIVVNSIKHDA